MDGFRATVNGGRLVIGDPWYTHVLDLLILGFSLSTILALVAAAVWAVMSAGLLTPTTRVADGSGIPLEPPKAEATADWRGRLGIDDYWRQKV